MAGRSRRPSIPILNGRARLTRPTAATPHWTISWNDPITGKQRTASGGKDQATAETRAAKLLGDFAPEAGPDRSTPVPTLAEVATAWLDSNRGRWSSRTYDNYHYVSARVVKDLGHLPITAVTPTQIKAVDLSHLSRGQLEKTRTVVKGIFGHATGWIKRDPTIYSTAIALPGTKSAGRVRQLGRGDVPKSEFVGAAILAAYSTGQLSPARKTQAESMGIGMRQEMGWTDWGLGPLDFIDGLPSELANAHRRGTPNHYSAQGIKARAQAESAEIASLWRRAGLVTALGACGMRIGEILALRPRHFVDRNEVFHNLIERDFPQHKRPDGGTPNNTYRGRVSIVEQASQASKGKIILSMPKGGAERTTYLPAFLPNWRTASETDRTSLRAQIARHFPRFSDPNVSLWEATPEESLDLWAWGFTPIGLILWERLEEIWQDQKRKTLEADGTPQDLARDFANRLLFPTRNPARKTASGPAVVFEGTWPHSAAIVPGDGTYQSATNFSTRWTSPLYDHVSHKMEHWPAHRLNSRNRRGWTSHGFRHWYIESA